MLIKVVQLFSIKMTKLMLIIKIIILYPLLTAKARLNSRKPKRNIWLS